MPLRKGLPFKVMVSSLSAKIPLVRELRRSLEKITDQGQILGADLDPECPGRYFVDQFWQMPRLDILTIDELISCCHARQINAIIPTRDGELSFYARYRDDLAKAGIRVMVSPLTGVETCLDKLAFSRATNRILSGSAITTTTELPAEGAKAYVVKERQGSGSRKILLQASRQEALEWAEKLEDPIFQPWIAGEEYSIDVYLTQQQHAKGALVRRRDLVVAGEARITTTLRDQKLEETCCRLAEQLGLAGHLVFQGIRTQQGFQLIECNARFGGASTLAIAAGLESFYWFLLECLGEDPDLTPYHRSEKELRQVRYPADQIQTHSG